MSIYIGNDLEDRLKALEAENASLRKYNEYHQVVHEIDHINNTKRSHTQLDSRKQFIAFQDRVITINIKEAQHPLK